jgi:hypothetical protein
MKTRNGADYTQNYDVIVKWMAEALRGETLEVLGIKTGRIEEVFGFEPVDIAVKAGRVDVIVRDDTGAVYHIEEQRSLRKSDLYRFASYHFHGARQWPDMKDIILISGDVHAGAGVIETGSGKYEPLLIDFTKKDGRKRLSEIRKAAADGTFDNWLELVFLPLYGKETGTARSKLVEEILHFETELYHAEKIPVRLLAATLIMSNKLIDKDRLKDLWEDIKMLDILEIAREKGLEEGLEKGREEGRLQERLEMLIDTLIERFGAVHPRILEQIRKTGNPDILKILFRQSLKCKDIQEFEKVIEQMLK